MMQSPRHRRETISQRFARLLALREAIESGTYDEKAMLNEIVDEVYADLTDYDGLSPDAGAALRRSNWGV